MPYKDLKVRRAYHQAYQRKYMPLWRHQNPEAAAKIADRYNHSLKRHTVDKRRAQTPKRKAWRQAFDACRRAKKKPSTLPDWIEIQKIYRRAEILRQWFDVVVDHIIPLARGGTHSSPGNLQIIYRKENNQKGAKLDFSPSVIFG